MLWPFWSAVAPRVSGGPVAPRERCAEGLAKSWVPPEPANVRTTRNPTATSMAGEGVSMGHGPVGTSRMPATGGSTGREGCCAPAHTHPNQPWSHGLDATRTVGRTARRSDPRVLLPRSTPPLPGEGEACRPNPSQPACRSDPFQSTCRTTPFRSMYRPNPFRSVRQTDPFRLVWHGSPRKATVHRCGPSGDCPVWAHPGRQRPTRVASTHQDQRGRP